MNPGATRPGGTVRRRLVPGPALLAVLASCGGSGPGHDPALVEPPPAERHLWDTEDPGAAQAPTAVLVLLAVAIAGATLRYVISGRRRAGGFQLPEARRTQILARRGTWPAAAESPSRSAERDDALIDAITRIANDGSCYATGQVPSAPGVYQAQARLSRDRAGMYVVRVVVDAGTREILAAHGVARRPDDVHDRAGTESDVARRVRDHLERARAALPASLDDPADNSPPHPDSIATIACWRDALDAGELEVALYALAGIARRVRADGSCRRELEAAATALGFDVRQRARALGRPA